MTSARWFGIAPAGWKAAPLYGVARERKVPNRGLREQNLLSLSYGKIVRKDINASDGLLPASFETYQIVEPNDIVLRMTDLQNDKRSLRSGLVSERGIITSAYLTLALRHVDPRFMAYQFRAIDLMKVFYSMGGGLRQSIGFGDLKRLPLLIPPLQQQRAIADYLDREAAQIDAFIARNEELITLLTERRAAVVHDAILAAARPNSVPTSLPWAPLLPRAWEIVPLGSIARERKRLNTGLRESNRLSLSYGQIVPRPIDTDEGLLPTSFEGYQIVEPGEMVFRLTDLQNDQRSLRSGLVRERGIVTSAYLALSVDRLTPDFAEYVFRAIDLAKVTSR